MKKISLSISPDGLFALEKLLNQVPDFRPTMFEGFVIKSACIDVAEMVHRKYRKVSGEFDVFNNKKKIKINLKYHECYHLLQFMTIMESITPLHFHLQTIKNFLDQKTA
ncbi:hypothetical protein [Flavobacterium branchiophilum]|uniref:Uncharacterized protein n=1 Tax=Flavobacterium branchiophilum TaxID=55197 RepID=A0A2H3K901_9FLAO|nr:hypothetical protein [Flavobacterium branchiophilum]PDS22398.1 hypothetical protein B0A77_13575 [Flavobacterium branchiophilum]